MPHLRPIWWIFAVLFPHFRVTLPHFTQKKTPRANQRVGGMHSYQRNWSLRGGWCGVQADLRADVSDALRLTMKAFRRAPRAQGITVSFLAAVSTTFLIKRVLVFIVSSSVCIFGSLPLLEDQYAGPIGRVFGV